MSLELLTAYEMSKDVIRVSDSNQDDEGCHYSYCQQLRCPRMSLDLLTAIQMIKDVITVTDSNRDDQGFH